MTDITSPTILIVPGLRDHVAAHWQTFLEQKLANAKSVPRMEPDQDKLSCAAWVAELDKSLGDRRARDPRRAQRRRDDVVHWAQRHRRPIAGALLAAPPDFESPLPEGYPTQQVLRDNGWLPTPRFALPFPTIVGASANDPLGRYERVEALAQAWGSKLVNLGNVGHLNPASGYGEWPQAEELSGSSRKRARARDDSGVIGSSGWPPSVWRGAPMSTGRGFCSPLSSRSRRRSSPIIGADRRCSTRFCSAWRSTPSPPRGRRKPAWTSPRGASCASAWRCSARGSPSSRSAASAGTTAR